MSAAQPSPSSARAVRDRCQRDPVWFVREILGHEPWEKQVEIIESVRDYPRTAVRSCHGAGKSFIAADLVLWFLSSHADSRVLTTAPTFRQVEKVLWPSIRKAYKKARYPLGGRLLSMEIRIDEGWFAFGFSTDDPDAFQGHHADHILVIFDEASGIPPGIWTAADGVLSSEHARLLSIGNPTDPISKFADEFTLPGTSKIAISAFDTPNLTAGKVIMPGLVTPAWVEDKRKRWGEQSPLWLARVLGQFPDASPDTLIPLRWIEAAQERELKPEGDNELGVDVARYGNDRSVIIHRRGSVARTIARLEKQGTMETTGHVVLALRKTKAVTAKVDVIGIGAGVVDRLIELHEPVESVNVGEKAFDEEKFSNRRAEVFWELRERFERGDIDLDPADEDLAAQLAALKWKVDSAGRIKVESKDDMRKRLAAEGSDRNWQSPDDADALALAFAERKQPRVGWGDIYGAPNGHANGEAHDVPA